AVEVQRAVVAGAVLAEVLASDGVASLLPVVQRWCDREERAAADVAQHYATDHGPWSRRLVDHVREQGTALRALVDGGPAACQPHRAARGAFAGRWPGPFNYRGLLSDLPTGDRNELVALFLADKRNYAVLTHLAMLADGCGSRDEAIDASSL